MIFRILSIFCLAFLPLNAIAGDVTGWVDEGHIRSRFIAGPVADDGSVLLGWEVELQDGWKTYWRSPGEAGLPPRLTLMGQGVANWDMLFPLPERFELFGIQTFGYSDSVLFPVRVKLQDAQIPQSFQAEMSYMVCLDVCIPYKASYDIVLNQVAEPDQQDREEDRILDAMQKVPLKGMQAVLAGIRVMDVSIHGLPGWQTLEIVVKAEQHLAGADAIVEAGQGFRFKAPDRQLLENGKKVRFIYPVVSMEKTDLLNENLTVTVKDGWGNSIEMMHYNTQNNIPN